MAYMAAHSEGSGTKGKGIHGRKIYDTMALSQDGHLHERGARYLGKTATDGTHGRFKARRFCFSGIGHKFALAFFWQVKDSWVMA